MESEGGSIVVASPPTTLRRSTSQHLTLRNSSITSDIAVNQDTATIVNHGSNPTSSRPVSNLTLGAVLSGKSIGGKSHSHHKKSWKSFKESLKCKKGQNRSSHRWTSLMRAYKSDMFSGSSSGRDLSGNRNSLRNISIRRVDILPVVDDVSLMEVDSGESSNDVSGLGNGEVENEEMPYFDALENQPVRICLMDLLEETDRQAGISGPSYRLADEEGEEDMEEDEMLEVLGKGEFRCCVCTVRHKGAAFIPCGHTFCRSCSLKLFVQRGNCPLCNDFILEILHIF